MSFKNPETSKKETICTNVLDHFALNSILSWIKLYKIMYYFVLDEVVQDYVLSWLNKVQKRYKLENGHARQNHNLIEVPSLAGSYSSRIYIYMYLNWLSKLKLWFRFTPVVKVYSIWLCMKKFVFNFLQVDFFYTVTVYLIYW